jgi:integrative and conjugative element protein (TIGR02256 family)
MSDDALEYELPGGRILRFAPSVLERFRRYRQSRPWRKEAGGQLFASLAHSVIEIVEATGPRASDRRSLFGYIPDRAAEQAEIKARYARGLHFIGDWHTHRQTLPEPSWTDLHSMQDTYKRSDHDAPGFALVVVGTAPFPDGLHVSYHQAGGWDALKPKEVPDAVKDSAKARGVKMRRSPNGKAST